MSFALKLANRGYDEHSIFRALAKKPSGGRDHSSIKYQRLLDERGRDAADAYARRTAERAVIFVGENPKILDRTDALVRIAEIEAKADALPWQLYFGPGLRRTLDAAFVVAERSGKVNPGLALREWAEIAGQTFSTVRTNSQKLLDLGWLVRLSPDPKWKTGRYGLRLPSHIHSHGRSECVGTGGRAWVAHDAFRPECLGDLGWYVLRLMDSRPTAHELSIRGGIDPDDIDDVLAVMERADLFVVDEAGRLHRVSDPIPALDDLARTRGTLGSAQADRAQHRREREAYRGLKVPTLEEVR
jgi:hypothetical protein